MTASTKSSKRWMLLVNGQMSESFATKRELFAELDYATDYDLRVIEVDLYDLSATGQAVARDVSEDIAQEYWSADGQTTAYEAIDGCRGAHDVCGLLQRFYSDELATMDARASEVAL